MRSSRPAVAAPPIRTITSRCRGSTRFSRKNRQFVTLYETLFTPETITALSAYIGIAARPEAGGAAVNAAGDRSALPDGLAEQVFPSFEKDYETVLKRLPQAQTLWPHAHLL